MARILLVEDARHNSAAALHGLLREAGHEVEQIADGAAALDRILHAPPALTLLEVALPRIDGLRVLEAVRSLSDHPIIMLTARTREADRLRGLDLGADDYVCKPFSPRELVARVRAVLRRAAPGISDQGTPGRAANEAAPGLVLDDVHWRASLEGTPLNLTRREFGLLQVLSRHPGRIFSRARLLELAYDDTVDVTERAIDSHVKNLRRKLGAVTPEHDWIRSVYGVGFAWEAPPPAD